MVFRCPSCRHEAVPCCDGRAWEDQSALGCAYTSVYDWVGSKNVADSPYSKLRVIRSDGVVGACDDQASLVLAQDEFAEKYVCLGVMTQH
jgi:hypothetical protein